MRIILINPTHSEATQLVCENKIQSFPHAKRDSGKALITALKKLKIQPTDTLQVIVGPGNFTAIRSSALAANAIAYITKCKLAARKTTEKKFRSVKAIIPFYESAPSITIAKKLV
jgi:hypothetical protein